MGDQEHEALQRTRQVWEHEGEQKTQLQVSWTAIPYFEEQIARELVGPYADTGPHALSIASARYAWALLRDRLPPTVHQALTGGALLCGDMSADAQFFEQATGVRFEAVHGYDLSPRLLAQYRPAGLVFHAHPGDGKRSGLGPRGVPSGGRVPWGASSPESRGLFLSGRQRAGARGAALVA